MYIHIYIHINSISYIKYYIFIIYLILHILYTIFSRLTSLAKMFNTLLKRSSERRDPCCVPSLKGKYSVFTVVWCRMLGLSFSYVPFTRLKKFLLFLVCWVLFFSFLKIVNSYWILSHGFSTFIKIMWFGFVCLLIWRNILIFSVKPTLHCWSTSHLVMICCYLLRC